MTVSLGGGGFGHVVIVHHAAVRVVHSTRWVKLGGGHVASLEELETTPSWRVVASAAGAIYLLGRVVPGGGCLRRPGRYVDAAVRVICKDKK